MRTTINSSFLLFFTCLVGAISAFSTPRVFVSTPSKHPARLVSDCMVQTPKTLSMYESVEEAISKLLHYGYSGAPVVDDDGNLVGVVSAFDFLQKEAGGALLPMEGSSEKIEAFAGAARKIIATSVKDLMTANPITITPHASMREAAMIMTKEHLNRLPVVDKEGKLVGILSTADVMKDVLGTVKRALPDESSSSVELMP
jgi:CBS domain-containing protein